MRKYCFLHLDRVLNIELFSKILLLKFLICMCWNKAKGYFVSGRFVLPDIIYMYVSESFVPTNVWSFGRFVPPMFCLSGHLVPPDVNSYRSYVSGCYISRLSVSGDVYPSDVLSGHPYISTGTQNKFQILNILCTYGTFIAGLDTIGHIWNICNFVDVNLKNIYTYRKWFLNHFRLTLPFCIS